MANNGILIEAGIPTGGTFEEVLAVFRGLLDQAAGMKGGGLITDFRFYMPVTGNRTQRGFLLMLECTNEQLEPLVVSEPYIGLITGVVGGFPNFTTNRVVFGDILERVMNEA